jgi:hypothetical protein
LTYKEIIQKIIDLLSADEALKKPNIIREYYFGRPPQLNRFPCIFVEFEGGPIALMGLGGSSVRKDHNYRVTVCHRLAKQDVAEQFVCDATEAIEANIRTNRTLSGLVTWAKVIRAERIDELTDSDLKQIRITIQTFREV